MAHTGTPLNALPTLENTCGTALTNVACLTDDHDHQSFMRQFSHPSNTLISAEGMVTPHMAKRKRETSIKLEEEESVVKKQCLDDSEQDQNENSENDSTAPSPVPPSKKGITFFSDNDVLSGRGGGTNVHPGNRNFRDLINLHRRAYLKARKNDKPAISRAIVRAIRENNGRFLKKDEKSGMWFEIGDDAAREKTSQALRQRAPEMRKLLFDTEREEARAAAEEHLRQQRMIMGMTAPDPMSSGFSQVVSPSMGNMSPTSTMLNPALFAMANKGGLTGLKNIPTDPYSQMFSAALLGGGINRFSPNSA